ncbi:MAG: hypothetical protein NTY53_00850 [Kiritimatiellaeota bacterium]|nr:hypothetical protein [Kiritimatiellota bacterium]
MIYIEMSRDEDHGGGTWAFSNCVWAPTETRNGRSWAFHRKVLNVRQGDTVIHLRGKPPHAAFIGYSIASGDGFETSRRPPNPGEWNYARGFYRTDLSQYTPFHQPVELNDVFAIRGEQLDQYFDLNNSRAANKLNIFIVRQSGRLQCLNGAYLSDADDELLLALFGEGGEVLSRTDRRVIVSVQTGTQLSTVRSRLGQDRFSQAVKDMYGNRCCFPGCGVSDPRFLVGAHIARWSDNVELRGNLGNGLCLCLMHDKAFELGLFTLDEARRVFINPRARNSASSVVPDLVVHHGDEIHFGSVRPIDEALLEHWIRVDIDTMC